MPDHPSPAPSDSPAHLCSACKAATADYDGLCPKCWDAWHDRLTDERIAALEKELAAAEKDNDVAYHEGYRDGYAAALNCERKEGGE